jgi:hypothetical protein
MTNETEPKHTVKFSLLQFCVYFQNTARFIFVFKESSFVYVF